MLGLGLGLVSCAMFHNFTLYHRLFTNYKVDFLFVEKVFVHSAINILLHLFAHRKKRLLSNFTSEIYLTKM